MPAEKEPNEPITAKPGTPEHQRQFDRQALRAADAALRLGIVRVGCGVVALAMFAMMFASAMDMPDHGPWTHVSTLVFSLVLFVETAHVALRGRSVFLRFLLSGAKRRPECGSDLLRIRGDGTLCVSEWFEVTFDSETVRIRAAPPGREPWEQEFRWDEVQKVCFAPEFPGPDGIFVFTSRRPESYAIPSEAEGGIDFWGEIIRRGLFDAELAIKAAFAEEGLFCWPPDDAPESSG
ncbi:MAG TPA: hypothetical protein VMY37_27285 [Thermoguttaceae bacterium]|nr:hypothetical protein [Thermoguttaceae bacterium]